MSETDQPPAPSAPDPPAAPEVLVSFGEAVGPADAGVARPGSRRRLAATLVAAGVAVAVLIAGGAFAVMRMWKGPTGALPEDATPASVAAFARINLTPGLGQRVKFEALLRRTGMPDVEAVQRDVFKELGAPIAYDDVAPWFDDRLGVALWADPAAPGRPVTLIVAASKDNAKARTSLTAAQQKRGTDRLGFVLGEEYAVLAIGTKGSQAAATAAAAEARTSPLAKAAAFRSAVGSLPADQPLIGWADLAKGGALSDAFLAGLDEELGGDLGGDLDGDLAGDLDGEPGEDDPGAAAMPAPSAAMTEVRGTLVLGAQAVDNGLEVRSRLIGASGLPAPGATAPADVVAALGALSGDADAAGVVTGPIGDLETMIGGMPGFMLLDLFGFGATATAAGPPPGAGEVPDDPEAALKYLEEHPELLEGADNLAFGFVNGPGAKLAKALETGLAGARTVSFTIAGTSNDETGQAPVLVDLQLTDAAAAKRLQTDLADLTKAGTTTCEQRDDHVTLRTKAFAGGTGRLADSALFKEAMADGVAKPTGAVYVDGASAEAGSAVKAIGVTTGRDGADTVVLARIVIK